MFVSSLVITKLEKYIFIVLFFLLIFFLVGMRKSRIVPTEFQNFIEFLYEFLIVTINQQAGKNSQKFFPFFFYYFFIYYFLI